MIKYRTLPLGLDLGSSRVRVAVAEAASRDDVRVKAVSARDIPEDIQADPRLIAMLIEEIVAELGTRVRGCVTALGSPHASVRFINFPKMSWHERLLAAKYESQRFTATQSEVRAIVRVHRVKPKENTFAVGTTAESVINARIEILKHARLRAIAVDHESLALRRAIPFADAVLDVGSNRSSLHHYTASVPFSHFISSGGSDVTRGIAHELSIDLASAERRKRILGSAGAGTAARNTLIAEFVTAIDRARSRAPITRIVLVGNGARLPGLAGELESACNATVELSVPPLLQTDAYPEDVLRTAAPDWMLAAALTTWSVAA